MNEAFLALVKLGIGNESVQSSRFKVHGFETLDWEAIESLAERHGLLGVVYDGVLRHTDPSTSSGQEDSELLPLTIKLRWMGKVMQGYEQRYALYRKAVADLAAWYHAHGYRMMVLKGMACGLDWPKPEHRPYGDIDIWLFGLQEEADALMVQEFKVVGRADGIPQGFKVDNSHHHHTVFEWQGFTVENHYDFVNVHHQTSNADLEKVFKELGADDSHSVEICGVKVYLPSTNLHALFLIKHLASHFAADKITIRQLLDWAFFVEKHGEGVDWDWLLVELKRFGMLRLFDVVNAICVKNLGFKNGSWKRFDGYGVDASLKQRVLNDVISPEFSEKTPKHVWKRIPFRYRRWKANEWKHELCYKESMRSAFWSGVKNHILKPASI